MKNSLLFVLFAAICFWCEPGFAQVPAPARTTLAVKAAKFLRTELYFGGSKRDGSQVSNEDFGRFLAEVVTPRFPDGFTVFKATGQYRESSGRFIKESSTVLVLLYPHAARSKSRTKIEEIRTAYRKQFNQESVLRMDLPKSVTVYF